MTLREFVEHSHLQGAMGFLLLVISLSELLNVPVLVGLEHGFFLLGLYHVAQFLPNAVSAFQQILKWRE